eukprot:14705618-Alexandrium_andersonii.AAC.1
MLSKRLLPPASDYCGVEVVRNSLLLLAPQPSGRAAGRKVPEDQGVVRRAGGLPAPHGVEAVAREPIVDVAATLARWLVGEPPGLIHPAHQAGCQRLCKRRRVSGAVPVARRHPLLARHVECLYQVQLGGNGRGLIAGVAVGADDQERRAAGALHPGSSNAPR